MIYLICENNETAAAYIFDDIMDWCFGDGSLCAMSIFILCRYYTKDWLKEKEQSESES